MKKEGSYRKCSDCIHEYPCTAWNHGGCLHEENAERCFWFETLEGSTAYFIGYRDGLEAEGLGLGYARGFSAGLMAAGDAIGGIEADLRAHEKKLTFKLLDRLLGFMIENRKRVRGSPNGFVRWNAEKDDFEWHEGG